VPLLSVTSILAPGSPVLVIVGVCHRARSRQRGQAVDVGETVQWFEHHDVLVVPTLPCTAFAANREHPANLDGAPLRDGVLGWLMTYPFSLAPRCPVVSVPCGFDDGRLPIGLSIVGRPGHDRHVLSIAHRFEQIRPWRDHTPAAALTNH
jgi:Asp-tRNA(Asn)/Glu-tRNA(Gln) amidotransferase A subunit family amidase